MIPEPIISPDFTIEDIHKIREYHYELTKDMKPQERINFYNEGGRAFLKEMEAKKKQKLSSQKEGSQMPSSIMSPQPQSAESPSRPR